MVIFFVFDCSVWSYLRTDLDCSVWSYFAHLRLAQVEFIYIGIQIFLKVWPWNKLLHNYRRLAVFQTCSQKTHEIRVMAILIAHVWPCNEPL